MNTALILTVGAIIAAQWLHLWVRQRGNARLRTRGPMEPQVIGLGASFIGMVFLWAVGLRTALVGNAYAPTTGTLVLALITAAIGASLRIAAIERIGRGFSWGSAAPDKLITDGVYRYLKHPLILGYLLEAAALGLCGPRTGLCAALFLLFFFIAALNACVQITAEEATLSRRFPEEWLAYSKGKII